MAELGETFDATNQEYDSAINGWRKLIVEDSKLQENKKGTGSFLTFKFRVVGEEDKNRVFFENFTWTHTESEKAKNIGRARFAELCKACKVLGPKDTVEIHNIPFDAEVKTITDSYGPKVTIAKFLIDGEKGKAPTVSKIDATKKPW